MKRQRSNYPVYRLWYKTSRGVGRYHSMHKKSFSLRLQGLQKLKTLIECWWAIEYNINGDKNESIKYSDPKEALKVARMFTAKSEIKQFI